MDNAHARGGGLLDTTWTAHPEFIEQYLTLSRQLLLSKAFVQGDEFCAYCRAHGLELPPGVSHNVWVGLPRVLWKKYAWIEPRGKVEPQQMHNHMPTVTLWRSLIFRVH